MKFNFNKADHIDRAIFFQELRRIAMETPAEHFFKYISMLSFHPQCFLERVCADPILSQKLNVRLITQGPQTEIWQGTERLTNTASLLAPGALSVYLFRANVRTYGETIYGEDYPRVMLYRIAACMQAQAENNTVFFMGTMRPSDMARVACNLYHDELVRTVAIWTGQKRGIHLNYTSEIE